MLVGHLLCEEISIFSVRQGLGGGAQPVTGGQMEGMLNALSGVRRRRLAYD
jgi:hypothetical protein